MQPSAKRECFLQRGSAAADLNSYMYSSSLLACVLILIFAINANAQETILRCDENKVQLLERTSPKMPRSQAALDLASKRNQFVKLRYIVNLDGSVDNVEASFATNKMFIKSAKKALRSYRYSEPEKVCKLDVKFTFRVREI